MGTYKPICITNTLTKIPVFCRTPAFYNTSTTHNDIKFGKESKTIIVVDRSLHSLKHFHKYTYINNIPFIEDFTCKPSFDQNNNVANFFSTWVFLAHVDSSPHGSYMDWWFILLRIKDWKCSLNWIHPNKRYVSMNEFFCLFVF